MVGPVFPYNPRVSYEYCSSILKAAKAKDTVKDYGPEELMKIANLLISDLYYRRLIDNSDYKVVTKAEGEEFLTVLPSTPEDMATFCERIPFIVNNVRVKVETKLNRGVRISDLLNELHEHHHEIFHYVF